MLCIRSLHELGRRLGRGLLWAWREGRRARAVYRNVGQIGRAVSRPPALCPLHGEGKTYRDTEAAQPVGVAEAPE